MYKDIEIFLKKCNTPRCFLMIPEEPNLCCLNFHSTHFHLIHSLVIRSRETCGLVIQSHFHWTCCSSCPHPCVVNEASYRHCGVRWTDPDCCCRWPLTPNNETSPWNRAQWPGPGLSEKRTGMIRRHQTLEMDYQGSGMIQKIKMFPSWCWEVNFHKIWEKNKVKTHQ